MKSVLSVFRFVLIDNLRSFWVLAYLLFMALSTYSLIYFTGSFSRAMVSVMNIVILLAPLVSTMMTSMYYFNKTDFLYLLLAQPVKRTNAFIGMYLGIAIPLSLAVGLGVALGILLSLSEVPDLTTPFILIVSGVLLSLVFSGLSLLISLSSRDKLRGIGLALFVWLFMAVIYDGLLLMYFIVFSEYPIEEHAIVLSMFNPIDLSRIFVMLHLDISALLGYSGAVFQKFFGTSKGVLISLMAIATWIVVPLIGVIYKAQKKDY